MVVGGRQPPAGLRIVRAVSTIDKYFEGLDGPARTALEHVRDVAVAIAPEAVPGVSYGIPALMLARKPLIGFRAAADKLSIYPFSSAVTAAVHDRLSGFDISKGTIRFTATAQIPDDVLAEVIKLRVAEIAGH